MDYNGWLGIKKRGGFKGDFIKLLKNLCLLNVEETNYTQMIKQFFLRFLDCRKILQSLNDFFILTVIHKGGSVVFLLRILLCLDILVHIVGSILAYLL